ncbi:MAG: LOG family protein [Acidimicrobiales bacterium]
MPERAADLLDAIGATTNRDQLSQILATVARLASGESSRLDLKIANAALAEMATAFEAYAPYRDVPKATMFGSARVLPADPLYVQAKELASSLALQGWMVVTGAGPGIMAAGLEGAGRELSFGINIRLPFEQGANRFIASDPKLVEMKYFFTRKLMLMKESDAFIFLPGGFGTLDEAFELLTLVQTGKASPCPVVMLDAPGSNYWRGWERFLLEQVSSRGLVSADDAALYTITDDIQAATQEILGFYRNYHSLRYVGELLVVRLREAPDDGELERLSQDFADICMEGGISRSGPLPPEVASQDCLDLQRVVLKFDRVHNGRLRRLIDALNALGPPAIAGPIAPGSLPSERELG